MTEEEKAEVTWEDDGGAVKTDEPEETKGLSAKDILEQMRKDYLGTNTRIAEQMQQGIINPIELARILSIRPQQVYQAIRHGALKVKDNNTQKKTIDLNEAARWTATYLNRKLERATKKEAEVS